VLTLLSDPKVASDFVKAVSSGIISSGVASCAKHFPGHGDTHVDSHLALPIIDKNRQQLDDVELLPFRSLIDTNIPSIMTAHIALPTITGNDEPASLSRKITHDILKIEMGYSGVVTTDCLEMEAIAGTIGTPAGAVAALQAGADIIMICHRLDRQQGAMDHAYAAVDSGSLSPGDLRESGKRIRAMKSRFAGTWDEVLNGRVDDGATNKLKESHQHLSQEAYSQSTSLVFQSPSSPLPLVPGESLVLYVPQRESVNPAVDDPTHIRNTLSPTYVGFGDALEKRAGRDAFTLSVYTPETIDTSKQTNKVVFVTQNAHIRTWQVAALKKLVATLQHGTGVVLVSTCAPYDLPVMQAAVGNDIACAVMATFEFTAPAFASAVEVLFGQQQAAGKIPVRLS
jgi:beta-N-acetylhexosaminidase